MQPSPRQKRLREQRSAFYFFLGLAFVYLVAGYPVIAGTLAPRAAGTALLPPFAELDANADGYVDSSEAAAYPAYAGTFAWADASADGRLSRAEFAAALNRLGRAP
ncbi:MAG TPA: hypothetical protein VF211_01225 [Burkholderiales bacterium]